jgi:hypothetical protein
MSINSDEILIVNDVEVVGIGGLRRHELEQLKKTKQIVLQTHESFIPNSVQSIYQEELLKTLQWLRPLRTESKQDFDFHAEQEKLFIRLFPKSSAMLGLAATKVRDAYLREMEWSSWLLQDHWRYFGGFVRQKFPDNVALRELVHWEWVHAWLEIQPFTSVHKGDAGTLVQNPSLQVVPLTMAHPTLQREAGLYAFVYDETRASISEKVLDPFEASLLDLLSEERKYTAEQLLQMAAMDEEVKPQISEIEWREKLAALQNAGLIISI